ncbi:MAG TPA: ATP-binding protein [Rhodopila sp.]|nr:ATP-binding protein [Rhodopila sp.]
MKRLLRRGEPQTGEAVQRPSVVTSAQQLESLGRVTGGVAHDFNNLLTVVLGNAAALRVSAEARGDAQGARRAELIERAAERGSRLAGQLLAFSGKQVLLPRVVSTYDVVSGAHHLLTGAAGESVRITLAGERNLWPSRVDPAQLESAILNLVLNARDAMPNGGNVTIQFRNRRVTAEPADAPWRSAGDYVTIDVRDSGTGIPPDLLDKVFEPFFTTKAIGKGSGLGLAQVHGFARQSGGWVELSSVIDNGTTISLFLPRFRRAEKSRDPEGGATTSEPRQTILFVDPDPKCRDSSCAALSAAGYSVLLATTASGAITHLVSEERICLLVTEEDLPGGINGADMGRHARTLRPELRILVCSGSAQHAPTGRPRRSPDESDGFAFLAKPFQAADLVAVVAALLTADTFSTDTEELLAETRERDAPEAAAFGRTMPPESEGGAAETDAAAPNIRGNTIRLGVAPFKAIGSSDRGVCAGLAEEITTAVAAFRMITCVSPASVAAVAQAPGKPADAWKKLDLDFVVEGSLRRKGDDIRVFVRLLRMDESGEITWTRRFDGKMSDVLNMQDRIAREIAAQVGPEVVIWEGRQAALRPQVDATAHGLMLRAIPAIYSVDQAGFAQAGQLLEEALALDPSNAGCHSWLAHWYLFKLGQGWEAEPARAIQRADDLSQRAIALDPGDARGFTVAGHVRAFLRRDAGGALPLHERALALNPSLALAWCYAGLAHSYLGNHAEAIRSIRRAQQLSPYDPHGFFFDMALTMPLLMSGDYETAARVGRRARDAHPGVSSTYKGLIAALGLLGAKSESTAAREALLRLEPRFSISSAIARSPLLRPEDLGLYVQGLRLAGIPERSDGGDLVLF